MTDRGSSTAEFSDAERQPGHPVAATDDGREPFTVSDLIAYHEANPQTRKLKTFR